MTEPLIQLDRETGSHYYTRDGLPCHEVPKKKGGGTRKTTIADARALHLLPSPTTIGKQSAKEGLERWKTVQACLTVITAPRKEGETDQQFVDRVLRDERQHQAEGAAAASLGSRIHARIAEILNAKGVVTNDDKVELPAQAAVAWLDKLNIRPTHIEQTVLADGVCGTCDLVGEADGTMVVVDWKSAGKPGSELPTEAWPEHKEQVSFYTFAALKREQQLIGDARAYVVYLSTAEPGAIGPCEVIGLAKAYESFRSLYRHWCYRQDYWPEDAELSVSEKLDKAGL